MRRKYLYWLDEKLTASKCCKYTQPGHSKLCHILEYKRIAQTKVLIVKVTTVEENGEKCAHMTEVRLKVACEGILTRG